MPEYESARKTKVLGRTLFYQHTHPTTMEWARSELAANEKKPEAVHGNLFLVEEQTNGIGRRQRGWSSPNSGNLYFSFIWTAQSSADEILQEMIKLNFAVPVAVAKACIDNGGEGVGVKWPNDVWAKGRKVSGMLVNFNGSTSAIVGVGINVNVDWRGREEAAFATSLREIVGGAVSRERVLASFVNHLEGLMALPWDGVIGEYKRHDILIGTHVRVHHGTRETSLPEDYDALVVGYAENGGLIVRNNDSGEEKVLSGQEITIRPKVMPQ